MIVNMAELKEPSCYEFQRLVFCLNFAPFEAHYLSQKNRIIIIIIILIIMITMMMTIIIIIIIIIKAFPIWVETVLQSTYMNDNIDSIVNEDEEVTMVQELKHLWRKSGMHLRTWLSNSKKDFGRNRYEGQSKANWFKLEWSAFSQQFASNF